MPKRKRTQKKLPAAPAISTGDPACVQFEVLVKPEKGTKSIVDTTAVPTVSNLDEFRQPADKMVETARRLQSKGITVHHIGNFSISAACTRKEFEKFFATKLVDKKLPPDRLDPSPVRGIPGGPVRST
jgi:hypothetical protein